MGSSIGGLCGNRQALVCQPVIERVQENASLEVGGATYVFGSRQAVVIVMSLFTDSQSLKGDMFGSFGAIFK